MEGAFRDAHDWVNNTGVGVLERDGQVTFEDAVKKRFIYYYDLVDVMSERASARPRASTDTMNMADGDTSSSSSSSSADEDDDDDEAIIAPPSTTPIAPSTTPATTPATATATATTDVATLLVATTTTRVDNVAGDSSSSDDDFASPSPITGTIGTVGTTVINNSNVSTLTSETEAVAKKRKASSNKSKTAKSKKAKKKRTSNKSSRGSSAVNSHEIDGDDDSWQVSMLDLKRGEVDLEQEKWNSQKQQHTLEIQLQQEKWKTAKQQQMLEYKFDLMVKYKKLKVEGFDNHQIVKMIPDMRPIIDLANMPVHLQLSQGEQLSQEEDVEE